MVIGSMEKIVEVNNCVMTIAYQKAETGTYCMINTISETWASMEFGVQVRTLHV